MSSASDINELTALIVDDEFHGRENLREIIESYCPEVKVLECADSVVMATKYTRELNPDVVFLDINMPGLDGFDFLDEFIEREFLVVFVSAFEEFGIKAVKAGAADYLLKPVNLKELKQTIKKLLFIKRRNVKSDLSGEINKLILPASHGFDVILFDEVIRFEADGCYTKVIMNSGKDKIVSRTLKDFEGILPADRFFRIHKSHIINLMLIKDYSNKNGFTVLMSDGSRIEISRRRVPDFINKVKTVLKTV